MQKIHRHRKNVQFEMSRNFVAQSQSGNVELRILASQSKLVNTLATYKGDPTVLYMSHYLVDIPSLGMYMAYHTRTFQQCHAHSEEWAGIIVYTTSLKWRSYTGCDSMLLYKWILYITFTIFSPSATNNIFDHLCVQWRCPCMVAYI